MTQQDSNNYWEQLERMEKLIRAAEVKAGARDEGMQPTNIFKGTHDEIVEDLKAWLQPGDWLLVKGSRGMAMEKVVQGLKEWAGEKNINR